MTLRKRANKTAHFAFRVNSEEMAEISANVDASGLSTSEFIRRRVLGKRIGSVTDLKILNELRRIGGLVKHVYNLSGGFCEDKTALILDELRAAIVRIGQPGDDNKHKIEEENSHDR